MSRQPKLTRAQLRAVNMAMAFLNADIEAMNGYEDDRERSREATRGYRVLERLVAAATPRPRRPKNGGAA